MWNIPAEKMKGRKYYKRPHCVPLSSQALAIIKEMRGYSMHSPFIFVSRSSRKRPCNSSTANMAIKRLGYGGRLTAHGLRSIASTYLNSLGKFDPFAIERCLAHNDKSTVRAIYNRTDYMQLRIEIMQAWGDYVAQCMPQVSKI
ncbi:site-specific integrase [Pasteurellaceae bacterium TAE3-ERU1]|nr:site-specific integrase [Pasteurellaceae bacterium TAE3-ERU1]